MVAEPTRGQLERALGQRIQTIFRDRIGQRPAKAVCQMFDESLTIVLEDTTSPAERTLIDSGKTEIAKQLRLHLQESIKDALKVEIAQIVEQEVLAVLVDADLDSGYASVTAILQAPPSVRDPQSIPKLKRDRLEGASEPSFD
ncbi:DUF2294 domain-containing protein [Microcoleus sp. FACHB-1515]|uniref:DUF2294 domain-containing protein n=1 Tax=Cyanophyceae TaxID=3028117 RepID=UPI001688463C|nr:DUF2294 domain-containing protein [Microcoleus sp. FACHB-1515]MBD2092150.1 DUF2294 domain-containing protein [Microcoleus sp. FACHB-1515]